MWNYTLSTQKIYGMLYKSKNYFLDFQEKRKICISSIIFKIFHSILIKLKVKPYMKLLKKKATIYRIDINRCKFKMNVYLDNFSQWVKW